MNANTIHLFTIPDITCERALDGDDLPTRFSGIAYSGGLIPQFGAFGDTAIDLDTIASTDRLFALVNHDPSQRAGHGRVWVEDNALRFEGQFARATEAGRQLAAEFKDGAPWQLSVGLQSRPERPSGPQTINGQSLTVKTLFRHAAVREVSFVPMGADPHTSVAAFAADLASPGDSMEPDKVTDLEAQIAVLQDQLNAEKAAREAAESTLAEAQAAAKLNQVKALFAKLNREWSDEAAAPFLALPEAALTLLAAELMALQPPALDPSLTQQVAIAGAALPDVLKLNAQLLAQVAGKVK